MSNLSKGHAAKPIWRPMDVLKNIDLGNSRFLQEDYSRPRTTNFKEWEPETQAISPNSAPADGTSNSQADTTSNSSPSAPKIDNALLEKEKKEAYAKGLKEGEDKAKAYAEKEVAKVRLELETSTDEKIYLLMQDIQADIAGMKQDPKLLHEPLKRLALHLAEQLTLTELSLSSNSIEALVLRCIETLDIPKSSPIAVELNPSDMAILQARTTPPGEEANTWRLQADPTLLPGSVRVRADDAVVTDLVEHRLASLAQSLLAEPESWQSKSAFQPERLSARRTQTSLVEDALPRESSIQDFQESSDIDSDVEPIEAIAKPLDLAEMDLPDLELPATPVADSTEESDPNHE